MTTMTVAEYRARCSKKGAAVGKTKGGKRKDIGLYVRSSWEANMVRIYRYTNTKFQYEPCEFAFEGIKRGCRFYKPDFYLPDEDVYVELKGYLNGESKTRLKRMLKYHPTIATKMRIVVDQIFSRDFKLTKIASAIISLGYEVTQLQAYAPLEKTYRFLPEWES